VPIDRDRLETDIRATVLPVIADRIDEDTASFLRAGGRAVLLGETREEYVSRKMTRERQQHESAAGIRALTDEARELAGAPVIVAVDQELGGIQRLHQLVPLLPTAEQAHQMSSPDLADASARTASAMRALGVNLTLAPILDVMPASNPWLDGRHLGDDPDAIARVGAAFIEGMQAEHVAAAAKHFPGNRGLTTDPALEPSIVPRSEDDIDDLVPFRRAIAASVDAVMIGPAVVTSIDPDAPASLSAPVHALLREGLGFDGLIISDDLDAVAIIGTGTLAEAGERALRAGADLLLIAGGEALTGFCSELTAAVLDQRIPYARVTEAATRVRALAQKVA
jgi:beta-N-acetylhexosaminidase